MINLIRSSYYFAFRLLTLPFLRFPALLYGLARMMAGVRSRIGYIGKGKSRSAYIIHMKKSLPDLNMYQLKKLLNNFWYVHQCNFIELFYLPTINSKNLTRKVEFEGLEYLEQAKKDGKGAILAAHYFGNERVIHLTLGMAGYPVHVLSSNYLESPSIVRSLRLSMAQKYAQVHFQTEGPYPLLQALKRNAIVQYSPPALGDVDTVRVAFLNHLVEFSTTPARLAMITGAMLTTAWVHRLPKGRFRVVIDPPLPKPQPADRRILTEHLAERMEGYIKKYPQEFYWMWLMIQSEETIPQQDKLNNKN